MMVKECGRLYVVGVRVSGLALTFYVFAGRFRVIASTVGDRVSHRNGNFGSVCLFVSCNGDAQAIRLSRCQGFMVYRASYGSEALFRVKLRLLASRVFHLIFHGTTCLRAASGKRVCLALIVCRMLLRDKLYNDVGVNRNYVREDLCYRIGEDNDLEVAHIRDCARRVFQRGLYVVGKGVFPMAIRCLKVLRMECVFVKNTTYRRNKYRGGRW